VIYRMRIYDAVRDNLPVFHDFFSTQLLPVPLRHGARLIGRRETDDRRVVATMLLAVPPTDAETWDLDTLLAILDETLMPEEGQRRLGRAPRRPRPAAAAAFIAANPGRHRHNRSAERSCVPGTDDLRVPDDGIDHLLKSSRAAGSEPHRRLRQPLQPARRAHCSAEPLPGLDFSDWLTLPAATVPTLFVWGADDPYLAKSTALATRAHVTARHTQTELEGVAHWLPELAPEAVTELLAAPLNA
jgi:pimeloyl-ACP methyl ester carboxylesterase